MPFDSNSQLPESVQNSLEESDQTKWRKIFNSAYADTCDGDDTCARKVAWAQMKKKSRWFAGWASVETVDKQGDLIEMAGFEKQIDAFFKMGAPIMDKHSNRKVGAYIDHEFKKKNGKPGLYVAGVIYRGYRIQDEVWGKISGDPPEYPALSIGADPMENKKECPANDLACFNRITDLETFEISPVDSPANPEATIEEVNHVAKSDNTLTITDSDSTTITKSDSVDDIPIITKGDSMTDDEPKEKEKVDGGEEPVAESTEKELPDIEKILKEFTETFSKRLEALETKAFPPEEEGEEEEKEPEDKEDKPEDDEDDKEKSTEVAAEPGATLTIKDIKKAIKEGVAAELKKLTATKDADTPRPDLKKHDLATPLQKIQADPDALAKMKTRDIDAMVGDGLAGERPW